MGLTLVGATTHIRFVSLAEEGENYGRSVVSSSRLAGAYWIGMHFMLGSARSTSGNKCQVQSNDWHFRLVIICGRDNDFPCLFFVLPIL
jgi:hypothetical protein